MPSRIALVVAATCAQALCQTSPDPAPAIDAGLEALFALDMAPGMAVVAVKGDRVAYRKGFGFAHRGDARRVTPDTAFYIASSTKSFFGLMASILHTRKKLDLDAAISRLSKIQFADGVDPDELTLRSLLTHTHGLSNFGPLTFRLAFSGDHDAATLRKLVQRHGRVQTGDAFAYGNIGYNLAGLIIEDALSKPWKELLRETVLDPLGLASTTPYRSKVQDDRLAWPYREEPKGFTRRRYAKADANMHSAGGLITTARDLGRWLIANLNGGVVDGKQAVPAQAVAAAHRVRAKLDSAFGPFGRSGYGLGWYSGEFDGETMLHHFGGFSGFHAHVLLLPERRLGVAVVTNSSRLGSQLAIESARHVYAVLRGRAPTAAAIADRVKELRSGVARRRHALGAERARRARRPQKLDHPAAAYAGTFENEAYGRMTFKVVDDRLECEMGRVWSAVEVFDASRNALRVELTGSGTVAFFVFPRGAKQAAALRCYREVFRRVE